MKPVDYEKTLARIATLMGAKPGTPEGDELYTLIPLVEKYEADTILSLSDLRLLYKTYDHHFFPNLPDGIEGKK